MAVDLHILPHIEERELQFPTGATESAVCLPLPGQRSRSFAHPAEAMLGDLLTFYRVRWVYEPTSFVLKRTANGAIAESFTPDFYLPDHRLYLELTTMRQPLVTRKNGKIRRLRELYPTVQIKTLYRRDYDRIMHTSGFDVPALTRPGKVVFDCEQILARVRSLADEIRQSLDDASAGARPLLLTAMRPEAEPFQRLLAEALNDEGVETSLDRIELSRFNVGSTESRVSLVQRPSFSARGCAVLLVAGATSTGLSLDFALSHLRARRPRWLETVSLLDRQAARVVDTPVRFCGFEAPSELLTGFGLCAWPAGAPPAILKSAGGDARPVAIIEV